MMVGSQCAELEKVLADSPSVRGREAMFTRSMPGAAFVALDDNDAAPLSWWRQVAGAGKLADPSCRA
jgi:hypothetical protein